MPNLLLARQSIYDTKLKVVAYELLFRADNVEGSGVVNNSGFEGDIATAAVVVNTFADIGLDNVVGQHKAFINFTRNLLLGGVLSPLPSNRIVVEVLEDSLIDEKLINVIKNISNQGYSIALDDFVYQPRLQPLVDLADIIKIDVLEQSEAQRTISTD